MGAIDKEDVVIFISKGGHSSELDLMIESVIKKGAVTIIVTENKNSVLAQKGSQTLLVKVEKEPDQFNMLATASTLAVISTFDAITIELSEERNYTQEEFLVIHPVESRRTARRTVLRLKGEKNMADVSISVFGADILHMENNLRLLDGVPVYSLHIDIMDGHFVPLYGFNQMWIRSIESIVPLKKIFTLWPMYQKKC